MGQAVGAGERFMPGKGVTEVDCELVLHCCALSVASAPKAADAGLAGYAGRR
jgi:hypothetical protein